MNHRWLKLRCYIYADIKKEWPNVRRMQVLGATVVPAIEGGKSLKEAVDSACEYLEWFTFSFIFGDTYLAIINLVYTNSHGLHE